MVIAFEGGLSPLHVLAQFLKLMTSLLFTKLVIAGLVVAHMSCTLIWRHDRRRAANLSPTKKVLTRMGTVRYKMRGLDFKPLLLPKRTSQMNMLQRNKISEFASPPSTSCFKHLQTTETGWRKTLECFLPLQTGWTILYKHKSIEIRGNSWYLW